MKELDDSTAALVRGLAGWLPHWRTRFHRRPRLFLVWVGGNKPELAKWATEHKLTAVMMGVITADHKRLVGWRINKHVKSTTVVLNYYRPKVSIVDLKPDAATWDKLDQDIVAGFPAYR